LGIIAKSFQVGFDSGFQFCSFFKLRIQFSNKTRHLFFKGLAIVFNFFSADIAAGREDVAMRGDCFEGC
jgi:hypothetical protein